MRTPKDCRFAIIPGIPVPAARPRITRHHSQHRAYTPPRYAKWKEKARVYMPVDLLEGPLAIEVVALWPRPIKLPGSNLVWRAIMPDVDNVLKAAMDAANGRFYEDDRQIARASCVTLTGKDREGAVIVHVSPLPKGISVPFGLAYEPCSCWDERCLEKL